jgi:hypothetical protein
MTNYLELLTSIVKIRGLPKSSLSPCWNSVRCTNLARYRFVFLSCHGRLDLDSLLDEAEEEFNLPALFGNIVRSAASCSRKMKRASHLRRTPREAPRLTTAGTKHVRYGTNQRHNCLLGKLKESLLYTSTWYAVKEKNAAEKHSQV